MREITVQAELHSRSKAREASCSCAPMAATLWSTLPDELLEQIFARLPLSDIVRLQCLSKTWKRNLASRDSAFKRACIEASPQMFAMVSDNCGLKYVSVKLCDIKANRWHLYKHDMHFCHNDMLYAGGGGLVCLVSMDPPTRESLITVFNPLDPRRNRLLPREALRGLELEMVQLVMDQDRRYYKVLAVGAETDGSVVAKIFSSETGAWDGEISESLVFGYGFSCEGDVAYIHLDDHCISLRAYEAVGHQLMALNDGSQPFEDQSYVLEFWNFEFLLWKCYALVKDHLFVLHEEPYVGTNEETSCQIHSQRFCISEYRGQKCKPHWVKLRTHRWEEFARPRAYDSITMSLYACKGFLLVTAENADNRRYRRHLFTWLYDMATEKWQAVPPSAKKVYEDSSQEAMFELHWDAIP